MKFNGQENFVLEPLMLDIRNNFTYEFWVKPEATHQIDKESIRGASGMFGKRYVIGASHGGQFGFAGIGVSVGTNGISVYEHTINHLPATLVYQANLTDWTHIAIVYFNKTPFLYINGEFKKRGLRSLTSNVFASGILGGLESYGNFVGEIRELRIWDHVRSKSQLKGNMNSSLTGKETGLYRYIHLTNNSTIKWDYMYKKLSNKSERQNFENNSRELYDAPRLIFPKASEAPLVSIIIPVYNNWKFTMRCLVSIIKNTKDIDYEVIIADDVSDDETVQIKEYAKNILVIRDEIKRGFLLNSNNAARFAKGKYLVFLNNDTEVQGDWLKYLLKLIENDQSVGMVGSKLIYPNGNLQEAGGIIWKDASGWNYGRNDDPEKPEFNYVKEVDYISGASIMIRSSLWSQIGGFDRMFSPAYFEDTDLAFAVRRLGFKVMFQPKSVVVHHEGISHGTEIESGIKRYQTLNQQKFLWKWRRELEKEHFPNAENVFQARDRSSKKKTMLVIDHYVPHFDKDAGSRSIYHYLKLFKEMGLNVKFIGDNFYRHEPYTTELQQLGIEVLYGNWYQQNIQNWIKESSKNIDYIFLNRPHISIKYIDFLKKYTDAKILYYGHDLHYLRNLREYNLFHRASLLRESNKWKKIEYEIMKKADVVYYLSQIEVNEIKKLDTSINAKTMPIYIFDEYIKKEKESFLNKSDLLFVGGFNHSPNVDGVLWFVKEIYPKIVKKIPDIKFYIVGSNPPDNIKELQSKNIIVTDYVSDQQLKQYYKSCRLAVVPLRYGAGVKGKVLEAMSNQVPVVTTSIGAEGYNNAENILTVSDTPDDFAKKVISLYYNETLLDQLSRFSFDYVKEYFSKEKALSIISQDIQP